MCHNGFSRKINLFKYKSHFKAYSKHELSTINMLSVSQKKLSYYNPTSLNGHLSTTATFLCPRVAVVERIDCIQFELQHNFSSW